MLEFYSSSTGTVNSKSAIAECLENALEGQKDLICDLIIIYSSIGHNFKDLLSETKRLCPNAQIAGCTGCGVIGREGPNESMKALAIMAIKGDKDDFTLAGADSITSATSFDVGKQLAHDLKYKNPSINMVHFLPAGFDIAADKALEGMESVFGTEMPIFGATSGDNMKLVSNFQFYDDKIIEKGAVAIGFADPTLEVITQATVGFNIMGDPFKITKSELNRIYEIEEQPALRFLAEKMGVPDATDFWDLVPLFTGWELPEKLHEEYGNTHQFFSNFATDKKSRMRFPVSREAESKFYMGVRDEERMFTDLDLMLKQLVDRCGGRKPYAVFHADCAARGRWSFNRVLKDEIIHRIQYPLIEDTNTPWLGLYGFGEFARLGNRNRFHMYTTSLFIILKKV